MQSVRPRAARPDRLHEAGSARPSPHLEIHAISRGESASAGKLSITGIAVVVVLLAVEVTVANAAFLYTLEADQEGDPGQGPADDDVVVKKIRTKVGVPAQANVVATRADMGVGLDYNLHIDVGGEGYHDVYGIKSGFDSAINLNAQTKDSQTGTPIPNLVQLQPWSTNPGYPFANGIIDYITMQGAPLTSKNRDEMKRVLMPGGRIGLWINLDYPSDACDNLNELARHFTTKWTQSCKGDFVTTCGGNTKSSCDPDCKDEFDGKAGFTKICLTDKRTNILHFDKQSVQLHNDHGDWQKGYYKAECGDHQRLQGLSSFTSGKKLHGALCRADVNHFPDPSTCNVLDFSSGDKRSYTATGDWDHGKYKGECGKSQYVAGVSQDSSGHVKSILCCNGNVSHQACSAHPFRTGDSREADNTLDWDKGYYKGECGWGRYVAGVSRPTFGGQGASAILCCGY